MYSSQDGELIFRSSEFKGSRSNVDLKPCCFSLDERQWRLCATFNFDVQFLACYFTVLGALTVYSGAPRAREARE